MYLCSWAVLGTQILYISMQSTCPNKQWNLQLSKSFSSTPSACVHARACWFVTFLSLGKIKGSSMLFVNTKGLYPHGPGFPVFLSFSSQVWPACLSSPSDHFTLRFIPLSMPLKCLNHLLAVLCFLAAPTTDQFYPPAVEAQSPNRWTTREFPVTIIWLKIDLWKA